ncbi:MAG TPA: DUF4202 domain-containing protein [Methylocystis sp.]|nr:DUF4202 domain-containing protein [Methylocystis sp.]
MEPAATRLAATLAAVDAANAGDPRRCLADGRELAFEQLYAERMTARLLAVYPEASELLQIAARAQHLRRWEIARDAYPQGRRGYDDWRKACRVHHADHVATIMRAQGYREDEADHVGALIRKEQLKKDKESQALENVAATVFLEHYFEPFLEKYAGYDEGKLIDILGKTLCKMSPRGHAAALALNLPPRHLELVKRAIDKEAKALERLAQVAVD